MIVGGGVSGLSCLEHIFENEEMLQHLDVTLCEGMPLLGGRVCSEEIEQADGSKVGTLLPVFKRLL